MTRIVRFDQPLYVTRLECIVGDGKIEGYHLIMEEASLLKPSPDIETFAKRFFAGFMRNGAVDGFRGEFISYEKSANLLIRFDEVYRCHNLTRDDRDCFEYSIIEYAKDYPSVKGDFGKRFMEDHNMIEDL